MFPYTRTAVLRELTELESETERKLPDRPITVWLLRSFSSSLQREGVRGGREGGRGKCKEKETEIHVGAVMKKMANKNRVCGPHT